MPVILLKERLQKKGQCGNTDWAIFFELIYIHDNPILKIMFTIPGCKGNILKGVQNCNMNSFHR